MPGGLEVVQEVLGLVLEAQHAHRGADLDVGERHARQARAGDDRVAVRAGLGVADRREHALLEHRRHRVLEALGLLVDLVPGHAQDVGEEALDQAVAAHDALGVLGAAVGERDRAVGAAGDVAVALEAADHLVDGRRPRAASRARRWRRSSAARPPAARRGSAGTPPRRRSRLLAAHGVMLDASGRELIEGALLAAPCPRASGAAWRRGGCARRRRGRSRSRRPARGAARPTRGPCRRSSGWARPSRARPTHTGRGSRRAAASRRAQARAVADDAQLHGRRRGRGSARRRCRGSLPGRQPTTTASIVRTRLTLTMPLRSPGR